MPTNKNRKKMERKIDNLPQVQKLVSGSFTINTIHSHRVFCNLLIDCKGENNNSIR